jgi:uncharacterized membrane protein HdeD (DUF308 family)
MKAQRYLITHLFHPTHMAQHIIERAVNRASWGLVLRGAVAIALGVFMLARPLESVAAFALVVAIWGSSTD